MTPSRTPAMLDLTELDADIRKVMHASAVPSLTLAVTTRDGASHSRSYGWADIGSREAATTETRYLWFSMSKIVTATAAMRLADLGKLDLDAPAHEHLNYVRSRSQAQPTMRHLLTHNAGLKNPLPLRWIHPAGKPAPDSREAVEQIFATGKVFAREPGTSSRYSNLGYMAAAEIIAEVAGEPFTDYVQEAILQPLGMTRTSYRHSPQAATGYLNVPRIAEPVMRALLPKGAVGSRHDRTLALTPFEVDNPGFGGLIGPAGDATRLLTMHLNDGTLAGARVLRPESAKLMRNIDYPGKPFQHGIGWFRKGEGDYVEHFGTGGGYWNIMRMYPSQGVGIVLMANTTRGYDYSTIMDRLVKTL